MAGWVCRNSLIRFCEAANGSNRPGQHVDINHKFRNITGADIALGHLVATNIHSNDGTQPDHQDHERVEKSVDLRQFQGLIFVILALLVEIPGHGSFLYIGFDYPDSRIHFLADAVELR